MRAFLFVASKKKCIYNKVNQGEFFFQFVLQVFIFIILSKPL